MKDKEKKQHEKPEPNGNNKEINSEKQKTETNNEIEELKNKIELIELELTNYKDRFLRKAAEFENYKRRTESDQLNLLKYGAEGFIRRILPVIDDFERSLIHMESTNEIGPIKEGVKLVYDKFMKILNEQGVNKIDARGKQFDVHFHEAVLQRKADGVEPHTVLDEIETGYLYNDKVIRHSKVIVSEDTGEVENNKPEDSQNLNSGENE